MEIQHWWLESYGPTITPVERNAGKKKKKYEKQLFHSANHSQMLHFVKQDFAWQVSDTMIQH